MTIPVNPLPRFSVKNSLLVNLLSVLIVVAGILAIVGVQREAFPNVAYDMVTVQTFYPGSTPQEVEKLITIPIEDELNEVDGIDEMHSASIEGMSMITIQLDPDAPDKRKIVNDIQRAADRTQDLPEEAEEPLVEEIETRDHPIMIVSLMGEDIWEVQRTAKRLEELLKDLSGVSSVRKEGWRDTQIWVEVDPKKLAAYHLSLDEVTRALAARNMNLPGGKLYVGREQHVIRTIGEFETPEEVKAVIIRGNDAGNWLTVGDVAEIRYALEESEQWTQMNGKRAVNLVVVKKEKADTLRLAKRVQDFTQAFGTRLTNGVEVLALEDLTLTYVRRRLGILLNNLSVGIVFLTIVLVFFLSPRMALLTAFGIPLAFFVALLLLPTMGQTINLLSLFGFIIVLGMLVDDGIVVAENSFRYLEQGIPPREAAIRGSSEVMAPVSATILTTIAAFAPLMFMTGLIGRFVMVIPLTVIIALLASWVESLLILPSHIADFSGAHRWAKAGKVFGSRQRWFKNLRHSYMRLLKLAFRMRWWVLAAFCVALVVTVFFAAKVMRFSLFPPVGAQTFFVRAEAPAGTSLEELSEKIRPFEEALLGVPKEDLSHFVTQLGMHRERIADPFTRRGTNLAQIQAYLPSSRSRRFSADEIAERIRKQVGEIEGLEVSYELLRPGPPVGKPIEVRIRGEELGTLQEIAGECQAFLGQISGVQDVRDDYEPGKPEYRISVDAKEAQRAGLRVRDIARTVRAAYEGVEATTIKRTDEEIDVLVRFPEASRWDLDSLKDLYVENPAGHLVPLTRVVSTAQAPGLSFIKHLDRRRVITVSAEVDESVITSVEVHQKLFEKFSDLPHRYPGYTVRYGGIQEETEKSMASLRKAFVIAVGIIYVILATTFQSLGLPLTVMMAIPFGIIGVLWAFFLHGEILSFMTLLGVVGLSGVVLNDSIILVTFINRARRAGSSLKRSILSAGFLRFRPVILTTLTTVVGLTPVAYGIGGTDPLVRPAALAIVWGLATATTLTLILIPCVYVAVEDIKNWCNRFRKCPPADPQPTQAA